MCLFPRYVEPNTTAYAHGIREFGCGVCPECLAKRARGWALRASMEAAVSPSCMITLTYDNYKRDAKGNVIGEFPPDRSLHVNKRDCQLFLKRLRRAFPGHKIKYLLTAEYGSHTHRAHYHCLLFGLVFTDLIYKCRSKRGNIIYRSPTLSRIWANASKDADWRDLPICSVDAVAVGPQIARYCTKYCSKDSGRDGGDDTFMLFSRGIGDSELVRLFNGKSYILDGREYPVPRLIWQKEISACYDVDFRYRRPSEDPAIRVRQRNPLNGRFSKSRVVGLYRYRRELARAARDAHPAYQDYLEYWRAKSFEYDLARPSEFDRIRALPDDKYRAYKAAAIQCYIDRRRYGTSEIAPPRSSPAVVSNYNERRRAAYWKSVAFLGLKRSYKSFGVCACHYTPNDTKVVRGLLKFPITIDDLDEIPFDTSSERLLLTL